MLLMTGPMQRKRELWSEKIKWRDWSHHPPRLLKCPQRSEAHVGCTWRKPCHRKLEWAWPIWTSWNHPDLGIYGQLDHRLMMLLLLHKNSLVALMEALCAWIFFQIRECWGFPDIFVPSFLCVSKAFVSNKAFLPPLSTRFLCPVVAILLVCWLYICACVCVPRYVALFLWKCVGKVIDI